MSRTALHVGLLLLIPGTHAPAQEERPPIIDMHVHAYRLAPDLDFPWVPEGIDPYFEPYLQPAEEFDVPVAFQTGLPIPGVVYRWFPKARASLGSPFGLEDALVRHLKLRGWIMRAGYPFLDETIAFLHMHPQVFVDLAEISWIIPRAEFHEYLRRLVQAGFAKRLMFGSHQMWWPDAIGPAIEAIETAQFLTPQERRDILLQQRCPIPSIGDRSAAVEMWPANKKMKLTSVERTVRSQLIPGVGRTRWREGRRGA